MDQQFPKFLLFFGKKRRFLSTLEAQMAARGGYAPPEITGLVLEADSSVRDMTPEEKSRVIAIFSTEGPIHA